MFTHYVLVNYQRYRIHREGNVMHGKTKYIATYEMYVQMTKFKQRFG